VKRFYLLLVLALVAAPAIALADDPPTPEQLEQAKKAFIDGRQLHDAGKLVEAIEKFKESYRLSRNALLLYNIGLTLDEAGQKDSALIYYRKFLSDAPKNAAQRKDADKRVKELEKEKLDADLNGTKAPDATDPFGTGKPVDKPTDRKPTKVKPPGTYGADAFQHQIVEEAPPGKPLDVTAFVPEDSGFTVTLHYRKSGDAQFTAVPMKWRYKELVARIPANKLVGPSIQYYVEVKDQGGAVVTRSGKSTSPNLVNLDASAQPKFFPDLSDEGGATGETKRHDEEDPLRPKKRVEDEPTTTKPVEETTQPHEPGNGFSDVGSSKFKYTKWGSTAAALGLLATSITFYALAGSMASQLVNDSKTPHGACMTTPCPFDSYDQALQNTGKRDQVISQVTFGVGIVAAGLAGYYWYKELTAKKRHELKVGKKNNSSPETTWVVTPAFGDGFAGASAAARF
jgi:hypothetical protein